MGWVPRQAITNQIITFLTYRGAANRAHHSSILNRSYTACSRVLYYRDRFGKEMCVNCLSQGLNAELLKAAFEPRTSRFDSRSSTTKTRRACIFAVLVNVLPLLI
ncbi:hypothetical protein ElyMa_001384100 [Elysia marginata]|uniref:Uncharacterized protein n=1 Tax=Elysia marginata TaxID=1093978 RepID=A0AAV4ISI5_9GAST|nr:hypothetical protein ElyMa_001384100 [Elysia marginata]